MADTALVTFEHLRIHLPTVKYRPEGMGWATDVALLIAPARQKTNSGFRNAMLRYDLEHPLPEGTQLSLDETIERICESAPETFPGTVVVGWAGVTNGEGHPVPFSTDHARALLRHLANERKTNALAADVLRGLVLFAIDPANFGPELHVETLTKN